MEENKVREKLARVISERWTSVPMRHYDVADAILQSPDLRVTLVEPKYFLAASASGSYLRERIGNTSDWNNVAFFYDADNRAAKDYCDWLNSKEPK